MSDIAITYTAGTILGHMVNPYNDRTFTKRYPGGAFTCYYIDSNRNTNIFLASFNKNAARVYCEDTIRSSYTANLEPVAYEYNDKIWYVTIGQGFVDPAIDHMYGNKINTTNVSNIVYYILDIIENDYANITNDFHFSGVEYTVTDIELIAIADAIRATRGTLELLDFPEDFISAIQAITLPDPIGCSTLLGGIPGVVINNSISQIRDYACYSNINIQTITCNSVKTIGASAFQGCTSLSQINFPICETINSYAFQGCTSLLDLSLPNCTQIKDSAFSNTGLLSVELPLCTEIKNYAFAHNTKLSKISFPQLNIIRASGFYDCTSLTEIYLPLCTTVEFAAFSNCANLTQVNLPVCTTLGAYCFYFCKELSQIDLPSCITVSTNAFAYCSNLTQVNLPLCTAVWGGAFSYCSKLSQVNLPECTSIGAYAFYMDRSLHTIIISNCAILGSHVFDQTAIRAILFNKLSSIGSYFMYSCDLLESLFLFTSSVPSLSAYAFQNTPITNSAYLGYFGSIFVPSNLYSDYISAINWSNFSSRFVSMPMLSS